MRPSARPSASMASASRNPGRTVRRPRLPSGSVIFLRLNAEVSFSMM